MNTIQEHWENLSATAPKETTEAEMSRLKHAFYAGAATLAKIEFAACNGKISPEAALAILDGCHDEIEQYHDQVYAS